MLKTNYSTEGAGVGVRSNQKGFSVIEAALLLVIIGIVGGAGWYVLDSNKKIDATNKTTVNESKTSVAPETFKVDLAKYANWTTYKSAGARLSFKYPALTSFRWSEITDEPSAYGSFTNTAIGDPYLNIVGIPLVQVGESGPANIMSLYRGSLEEITNKMESQNQTSGVMPTKKQIVFKGLQGVVYTNTTKNDSGKPLVDEVYVIARKDNKDAVVMDLSNSNEGDFDANYRGMLETLVLEP